MSAPGPRDRSRTRLVFLGGCWLAWLSAGVNVGFLVHFGTSVSHLTGDITRVAMVAVLFSEETRSALTSLFLATGGFIAGAALAGYSICHPTLELSRPYGRSLLVIGALLAVAHVGLPFLPLLSIVLASFACGLQNAMATHYRGVILRTTHMTGLLTDLGSNIGMRMRGYDIPLWKIGIPGFLCLSFFGGSLFGAALVLWWKAPFLLVFSGMYTVGGIAYIAGKKWIVRAFGTPAPIAVR